LTVAGPLSLNSDSQFHFEFDSSTGFADLVTANGISIAEGSTFAGFDVAVASVPVPFDTIFTVLNNTAAGPITGMFSNLRPDGVFYFGSAIFSANYSGGDGNDLVLTSIPEPSAGFTLVAGVVGMLGLQRLRRRNGSAVSRA
jgi:hypothetical protein